MKLSDIKPNPDNPRIIKDESFEKLCNSIKEFPKMMKLRPIVVDMQNMVLGGNMRLKALQHLGFKEIPDEWVKRADELTEDEKRRFIIADNVSGGEWDWDTLKTDWDVEQINEWGLDVPDWGEGKDIGDIVELDKIVTTYNINIKCDSPEDVEEIKFKLGITSNSIHSSMLKGLLA